MNKKLYILLVDRLLNEYLSFDDLARLYCEIQHDAHETEYAFGFPAYKTDKELVQIGEYVLEYMKKNYPKEFEKWNPNDTLRTMYDPYPDSPFHDI